jgi:hypothetical protein
VNPTRPRREALNEEVASQLGGLRAALDEMVHHYTLRIGGELADLESSLQPGSMDDRRRRGLTMVEAQEVLARIAEADLRPRRGRAKDFTRLRNIVRDLRAIWPDQ